MTKKADFNAEEWATVAEAPVLAGLRLVAAVAEGLSARASRWARSTPRIARSMVKATCSTSS